MKLTIWQLLLIGCLTVIPSPLADQSDATGRRIGQASARKSLPTFSIPALAATPGPTPQLAFPGAEGFGRYAQGGRGGDVYYVVNLNDSGPGSLREGLRSATGPRTIVFGVSGTIALKSRLAIDKPHITIAGQTAPGDGITLADGGLAVSADHVVVRYIRSRLGDKGIYKGDAVSVSRGSNVIIDHCSASWSIDEVLSMNSPRTDLVTVQWCIISEALYSSIHPKLVRRVQESGKPDDDAGGHSMGGILGAKRQTLHHNLYAHNNSRNPKISGKPRLVSQVDFRNNVIYNWGMQTCYDGSFAHANWANNCYKPGPGTSPGSIHRIFRIDNRESERDKSLIGDAHALFFIEGNYMVGFPLVSANNWAGGVDFGGEPGFNEANTRARTPFDYPRIACETNAQQAYELVLTSAGASLARDSVDRRIVEEARNRTASAGYLPGVLPGKGPHGIIRSQKEVGGWPVPRSTEAPVDSDRDGMPDWWEVAHKLNPNDPADRNLDRDGDGYTNLEEYLNWLADPAGRFLDKHPARAKAR